MPFVKGDKNAGRRDGSVNKKTTQWKTFSEYCLAGGLEKFKKELDSLRGRAYCDTFLSLLEFHQPKLSRQQIVDSEGNAVPIIQIMLPPEKLNGHNGNEVH